MDPRGRARQLTALAAVTAMAASCVATAEELEAAARARAQAERDLAEGRARIAFIGALHADESALDRESGLVRMSVGCCKDAATIAFRDAYNDAVGEARSEGRLAGLTFEGRATARADVVAVFAEGGGVEVRLDAAPVASPDGRWLLEISPSVGRDSLALARVESATRKRGEIRYLACEEVRIAFGKDGVTLLVRDDRARVCATYDLVSALPLEAFPDEEGRW